MDVKITSWLEDLLDDPHLDDVGSPALGTDTRAVLSECGYSSLEIDDMMALGIARGADAVDADAVGADARCAQPAAELGL